MEQKFVDSSIVIVFEDIHGIFKKSDFIAYLESAKIYDTLLRDSLVTFLINQNCPDTIIAYGNPPLSGLTTNFIITRILMSEGCLINSETKEQIKKIKYVRYKELKGESRKEIEKFIDIVSEKIILERILGYTHYRKMAD